MKKRVPICHADYTLMIIGGRWKVIIIWRLESGPKRFSELKKLIPEVTQKMLTQQLKELEEDGIVERRDFRELPLKVEYSLTELGRSVHDIIHEMCVWGAAHGPDNELLEK